MELKAICWKIFFKQKDCVIGFNAIVSYISLSFGPVKAVKLITFDDIYSQRVSNKKDHISNLSTAVPVLLFVGLGLGSKKQFPCNNLYCSSVIIFHQSLGFQAAQK